MLISLISFAESESDNSGAPVCDPVVTFPIAAASLEGGATPEYSNDQQNGDTEMCVDEGTQQLLLFYIEFFSRFSENC